jgi:transcriptional regulator with PAS, ATPase and Fis domain
LAVIKQALADAQYCKTKAAKALGITRTTLWRKLKKGGA